MFGDIMIDEPLDKALYDEDFLNEGIIRRFSTFLPVGHNIFGIRRRAISGSSIQDPRKGNITRHFELGPGGVIECRHEPLRIHCTTSGTPHRVEHNFGYWHINDKDELYLPLPSNEPDGLGFFLTIMGRAKGDETDRFAWYCQQCQTMLYEFMYETGRLGFNGFWKAEVEGVRQFNADERKRTCPECGLVNPHAYCWSTTRDSAEERRARQVW